MEEGDTPTATGANVTLMPRDRSGSGSRHSENSTTTLNSPPAADVEEQASNEDTSCCCCDCCQKCLAKAEAFAERWWNIAGVPITLATVMLLILIWNEFDPTLEDYADYFCGFGEDRHLLNLGINVTDDQPASSIEHAGVPTADELKHYLDDPSVCNPIGALGAVDATGVTSITDIPIVLVMAMVGFGIPIALIMSILSCTSCLSSKNANNATQASSDIKSPMLKDDSHEIESPSDSNAVIIVEAPRDNYFIRQRNNILWLNSFATRQLMFYVIQFAAAPALLKEFSDYSRLFLDLLGCPEQTVFANFFNSDTHCSEPEGGVLSLAAPQVRYFSAAAMAWPLRDAIEMYLYIYNITVGGGALLSATFLELPGLKSLLAAKFEQFSNKHPQVVEGLQAFIEFMHSNTIKGVYDGVATLFPFYLMYIGFQQSSQVAESFECPDDFFTNFFKIFYGHADGDEQCSKINGTLSGDVVELHENPLGIEIQIMAGMWWGALSGAAKAGYFYLTSNEADTFAERLKAKAEVNNQSFNRDWRVTKYSLIPIGILAVIGFFMGIEDANALLEGQPGCEGLTYPSAYLGERPYAFILETLFNLPDVGDCPLGTTFRAHARAFTTATAAPYTFLLGGMSAAAFFHRAKELRNYVGEKIKSYSGDNNKAHVCCPIIPKSCFG